MKSCQTCGEDFRPQRWYPRFCTPCRDKRSRGRSWAAGVVARAIKEGLLARAIGQSCADCGQAAHEYEHRDYSQPLKVDPICRSCNKRRGPGKWIPDGVITPGAKLYVSAYFRALAASLPPESLPQLPVTARPGPSLSLPGDGGKHLRREPLAVGGG